MLFILLGGVVRIDFDCSYFLQLFKNDITKLKKGAFFASFLEYILFL